METSENNNVTTTEPVMDEAYREVFGLDEPAEDPAENGVAGDNGEGEPAEGAQSAAGEPQTDTGNGDARGQENGTAAQQTPEERHRQAAMRRAREEEAAQKAMQQRVDNIYADIFRGQINPYTKQPISSQADYESYMRAKEEQERRSALEKAGIEPSVLEQLVKRAVDEHPDVIAARQAREASERAREAQIRAQADRNMAEGMAKISALDPSVKTMEDIYKAPYAQEFLRYVTEKKLPLEEAFLLANRQGLQERSSKATRQAVINQMRSKEGLVSGAAEGGSGIVVPADMAEAYRQMMPDASDAEIEKAWRSYQKELRK